jgi:hypothetical protein
MTDIYGVLYRPRGFDPGQRYPVVDTVYPGPQVDRVAPCFDPGGMGLDAEPIAALRQLAPVQVHPGPGLGWARSATPEAGSPRCGRCSTSRDVQGRSRPLRLARRPILQPGLRGGLRRRGQPRGLGACLQRGHRGPAGGQAVAHPRRNGRSSPPGPHATAGRPAHRRRPRSHLPTAPPLSPSTPSCSASCSPERDTAYED